MSTNYNATVNKYIRLFRNAGSLQQTRRQLALQLHPNKPTGSTQAFQAMNKAYNIVKREKQDPVAKLFDRYIAKIDMGIRAIQKAMKKPHAPVLVYREDLRDAKRFKEAIIDQKQRILRGIKEGWSPEEMIRLTNLKHFGGPLKPFGPKTTLANIKAEAERRRVQVTDMFGQPLSLVNAGRTNLAFKYPTWKDYATAQALWFMNNSALHITRPDMYPNFKENYAFVPGSASGPSLSSLSVKKKGLFGGLFGRRRAIAAPPPGSSRAAAAAAMVPAAAAVNTRPRSVYNNASNYSWGNRASTIFSSALSKNNLAMSNVSSLKSGGGRSTHRTGSIGSQGRRLFKRVAGSLPRRIPMIV